MAHRRARTGRSTRPRVIQYMPDELLLEVWNSLPPIERVCVSQACQKWRRVALSSSRLWTQVIFLSTPWDDKTAALWPNVRARAKWENRTVQNVFNPARGRTNIEFFGELLLRSGQLPLDVTILPACVWTGDEVSPILLPHASRIARLHIQYGSRDAFRLLLLESGGRAFPSLRTLTAGFDERDVVFEDRPHRITADRRFPALRQVHIGSAANLGAFVGWQWARLPGVEVLTYTPRTQSDIRTALSCFPNISTLNIVAVHELLENSTSQFRAACAHVRTITVSHIHNMNTYFVFSLFGDAVFSDVTFDTRGRAPWTGHKLQSPCRALAQPLRLHLRIEDSVYRIDVVDSALRHRSVIQERRTADRCPTIWGFWLRAQAVASAIVDAAAWSFFTADLPSPCAITNLTVVVHSDPEELADVALAGLSAVDTLRIRILKPDLHFPYGTVSELVSGTQLRVLTLPETATFEDEDLLSGLSQTIERE